MDISLKNKTFKKIDVYVFTPKVSSHPFYKTTLYTLVEGNEEEEEEKPTKKTKYNHLEKDLKIDTLELYEDKELDFLVV